MKELAVYLAIGGVFLAFFVVDDVRHGRRPQARDHHILFFWPLVAAAALLLGLFEISRITSTGEGWLRRPGRWV